MRLYRMDKQSASWMPSQIAELVVELGAATLTT